MDFGDMVAALRARWKIELIVALAVIFAVIVYSATAARSYSATASILFDEVSPDPTLSSSTRRAELLGTQADIIKSAVIATRVVANLGLARDPQAIARWRRATGGTGSIDAWLGRALLPGLDVLPGRNSNVLSVVYKSSDPQFAALLANGFAAAFVEERLRLRVDPARSYTQWFEQQSAGVRDRLEEAQRALTAFQREHGIVDDGTFNAENSRLAELSQLQANAEAQKASANGRAIGGQANSSVQDSGVVQSLRGDIARKTADLRQMRTIYGPNHPSAIATATELATLQSKLNEAVGTAMGALRVSTNASNYEASVLGRAVNDQRDRMLRLTSDRSQLLLLRRDVDSARATYDDVTKRLASVRLQSAIPRTNARQLDEARAPLLPDSPKVPLLLFLGALLGTMLGLTIGALLEWMRPKVRTPDGLVRQTSIPIVSRFSFHQSAVLPMLSQRTV